MKILMTVLQFPPFGGAAVSRIYSFAKYWSRAGHDVTVVTPEKYPFMGQRDYWPEGYEDESFKVVEVAFSPLFFSKQEQERNKHRVSRADASGIGKKVRTLLRKLRKNVIGNSVDMHRLWKSAVEKEALALLEKESFDVLFSSFSPQTSHLIASKIKQRYPELVWVADYRDLWTGNHLLKMHPVVQFYQTYKEKKVLSGADLITTVSSPLAAYLRTLHHKKVEVIFNGYDHEEWGALPQEPFFPDDGIFRIVYTGTIYEGTRDPSPLFEAIAALERSAEVSAEKLQIYFYGDSGNVMEIAQRYQVLDYVQEGGMLNKQDALRAQRDASLLLFLEGAPQDGTLSAQGVLTSKIFEYLASATPVLAIGIDRTSPIGELLESTGLGEAVGTDVDKTEALLLQYMGNRVRTRPEENDLIRQYRRVDQAYQLEQYIIDLLKRKER